MSTSGDEDKARDTFNALLGSLRPKLHRYCARMTGSVIDGEDVVQDALADALASTPDPATIANPEGWLFRIAHTTALDYLRKRARREALTSEEDPDMMIDAQSGADSRVATSASLRTFMALPASQRSSVILMDVLGYSLEEIGAITATTVPAIKAALHRGRTRLRELAHEPDVRPLPALPEAERARLAIYIDRFNARDLTVARMLATSTQRRSGQQQHGKTEIIGVQDPFERFDRGAQVGADGAERRHDHDGIEDHHERRRRRQHQRPCFRSGMGFAARHIEFSCARVAVPATRWSVKLGRGKSALR